MCVSAGIPQLVIFTKIDKACPEVEKNINNAYYSELLKEQVSFYQLFFKCFQTCDHFFQFSVFHLIAFTDQLKSLTLLKFRSTHSAKRWASQRTASSW